MTRILLTGAGFSYNWGGWLAKETFEYLLGCDELSKNVRYLLWKCHEDNTGFEGALSYLQNDFGRADNTDLNQLLTALHGMFNLMNQALAGAGLDFPPHSLATGMTAFLGGFDALFTLNQDLLLEHKYNAPLDRWSGWGVPGVKPLSPSGNRFGLYVSDAGGMVVSPRVQPYFKLHGSSNFLDQEQAGTPLLIMGGNKVEAIQRHPLLGWYHDQFFAYLTRPNTRLVVIGYSFGDAHINEAIMNAARSKTGLRMFIVDPQGVDVIDKRPPALDRFTQNDATELVSLLRPIIRGASRRPLSATFGFDTVEYSKLNAFLG